MKKSILVLLSAIWIMMGSAPPGYAHNSAGIVVATFVSANGQQLIARYAIAAGTVSLKLPDGKAVTLPLARSASGSRYSNGTITFWEHQGTATLYRGETVLFEGKDAGAATLLDAVVEWGNGKAYFFKGNQYIRYDIRADKADQGYPKPINQGNWPGIPWTDGIDAVANWGNGKAYFFKGNQYIRYDIRQDKADPGYPKPIDQSNWPGIPWTDGIDAVVNWGNGKAYFFKGDQYIRYDIRADRADQGYPKPIDQGNWPGIPWSDGIDAVANWGNGKAYFFKGNRYIRYDIRQDRADQGYPKPIDQSNWPGVPGLLGLPPSP